jgi:NitT/TauT family transport system substrate-binding protein
MNIFLLRRLPAALMLMMLAGFSTAGVADELRVGTWKTAQTIQPFFYHNFLPAQVKVDVRTFTNPADQKTALLAGSLTMTGTTLAHAIHSATLGQPVVIVAALCNRASALVVGSNSGIETVADLKGKTIGYVPGTMHEILLRETLQRNGLSPATDVRLMRVDFFDMGIALSRGNIDAFLSGEPFPTLAIDQGYGRILSYPYFQDSVGTINAAMIVNRSTIVKNPELVQQLVNAHAAATDWLNANPQQWLLTAAEFGTPLPILEQAVGNMELAWNMDDAFVRQVQALGAQMQALGIISRQPDYEQLLDLSFVRKISSNP